MAINLLFKSVLIVVFKGQNSAGDMNVPIRKELRIQTQNYDRHKTFETNLIFAPYRYMDVSKNCGTPKSSILIGFSIINHPF